MSEPSETPAARLERFATRGDDLVGIVAHVLTEIDLAAYSAGPAFRRAVCGVAGRAGVIEDFMRAVEQVADGASLEEARPFVKRLPRSNHDEY